MLTRAEPGEYYAAMPDGTSYTLCAPVSGVTCFHCCPPIRPPDHDPWVERERLRRILRKNTSNLAKNLKAGPIEGTSCWALGFLDRSEVKVGCLLHPARNGGRDLRDLTGYGEKCAREFCLQATVFARLTHDERKRCLASAPTTDSFLFSSSTRNPLMRLLAYDDTVVRGILERERDRNLTPDCLTGTYGALFGPVQPARDGFWISRLVANNVWRFLDPEGLQAYLGFRQEMEDAFRREFGERRPEERRELPMVHEHPIPLSLSRWLKFGVNLWRADRNEMNRLEQMVEAEAQALAQVWQAEPR